MKNRFMGFAGVAVLGLCLSAPVFAHCGHCGMGAEHGKSEKTEKSEKMRARHLEKLTEKLSLTPEQQTQVKAILDEKQTKMEQVRAETHQKIKAVLTEEQKAKFDDLKAKGAGCGCPMCAGKSDCDDCASCAKKGHGKEKGKGKK